SRPLFLGKLRLHCSPFSSLQRTSQRSPRRCSLVGYNLVPPRLCSLQGLSPGRGLVLCQRSETVTRPLAVRGTSASRLLGDSGVGVRLAQPSDRTRDNATGTVWPSECRENELSTQ